MDTSLAGMQRHFDALYKTRNLFVNGSYHERATHLVRRVGRLYDAHRKGEPIEMKLARAFSYFMSVVNYFDGEVSLTRGMRIKFPSYGCAYCHQKPCACTDGKRPAPVVRELDPAQETWTLKQWQDHLFAVYGERNLNRHPTEILCRLMSEVGELGILNAHGPDTPLTPQELLEECQQEAADILSWLIAVAYINGIDLQKVVVAGYQTCPGCKQMPCCCPLIFMDPDGRHFSTVGTRTSSTYAE